jgi:hypothetical protein
LQNYGVVLDALDEGSLCPVFHENLPRGTTMSIPGSIIHAGPSCNGLRSMLFFTAHPKGKGTEAYSSESQYFHGIILIEIVTALLSQLDNEDNMILLRKLHDATKQYKELYLHIADRDSPIFKFLKQLVNQRGDKDKLMSAFATPSVVE